MKDSFFHSLVSIAVKCRWLIFIALFVSAIFSATLATGIRFDFSPEALFVKEELEFARETHKVFDSHSRHIVFVLEATTAEDVFSPEALNWQYQVGNRGRRYDSFSGKVPGRAFIGTRS